jgi:hypothetical protein
MISTCFRPQYCPQIECWALLQPANRKRKLFDFLSGHEPKRPARPTTSLSAPAHSGRDLLLSTPTTQINLALSFAERPVTRQNNKQRFASPGCTSVFHEDPVSSAPAVSHMSDPETIATWIVRKLMNPSAVGRFRDTPNTTARRH